MFDTDCDSAANEIIERYAGRCSIEITNRAVKQLLGSADPQRRAEHSVFRAPMIAHWAYSLVVVWFVSQWRMGKRFPIMTGPWYGLKKDISFADMLAAARRSRFSIDILEEARERPHLPKFDYARCTKLTINAKVWGFRLPPEWPRRRRGFEEGEQSNILPLMGATVKATCNARGYLLTRIPSSNYPAMLLWD